MMSIVVRGAIPKEDPHGAPVEEGSSVWLQYAVVLSLVAGSMQLLLGVCKAGRLCELVPESVLLGFTAAAGWLIALGQVPGILGVAKCDASVVWGEGKCKVLFVSKLFPDIWNFSTCMSILKCLEIYTLSYSSYYTPNITHIIHTCLSHSHQVHKLTLHDLRPPQ